MEHVIVKAIDYIMENITDEITVEDIANHCHYSKYYFNRLFKSVVGESIYAFIKRLRIEETAFKIANQREKTITEIVSQYGYSSSNFSSSFKDHYGIAPVLFKRERENQRVFMNSQGYYADLSGEEWTDYDEIMEKVDIDDFKVIFRRYIGNYHDLEKFWSEFLIDNKKYIENDSICYEISYDDPIISDADRCIMDLCIEVSDNTANHKNIMVIKGGRYLKYKYSGPKTGFFKAFQGIMGVWMPEAKYKVDFENRKMISKYLSVDCDKNFFRVEIYIPIL